MALGGAHISGDSLLSHEKGGSRLAWKQSAGGAAPFGSQGQEVDSGCIVMEFDMPDKCPPSESVARVLKEAMGDSHESATLTCTMPECTTVYRWTAGQERIEEIPFPDIDVKLSACFISDGGNVMVALVCGAKDEVALWQVIDASTEAMTTSPDKLAVEGELQRMTLDKTLEVREPDMSLPAAESIMIKSKELRLRARVDGIPQMQHLMIRKCYDLSADGGCVVAVFGGRVPWSPDFEPATASLRNPVGIDLEGRVAGSVAARPSAGTTQLQLTSDSIIIDRYELTDEDIVAMQEEIQEIENDTSGSPFPDDISPPLSDQEDEMQN